MTSEDKRFEKLCDSWALMVSKIQLSYWRQWRKGSCSPCGGCQVVHIRVDDTCKSDLKMKNIIARPSGEVLQTEPPGQEQIRVLGGVWYEISLL